MSIKEKVTLILGDNIDVIPKLVDFKPNIIYIDPPYNTGNKMIYKDNYDSKKWNDDFRLRLIELKKIIDKDSIIYISIGQEKLADSIIILTETIGKPHSVMPRKINTGGKTTKTVSRNIDYLIIYINGSVKLKGLYYEKSQYKHVDERGKYQLRRLDYKDFKYTKKQDSIIEFKGKKYFPGISEEEFNNRNNGNFNTKDWCWLWCDERIQFAIENDFIVAKEGKLYKKTYVSHEIKDKGIGYCVCEIEREKPITSDYFIDNHFMDNKASDEFGKIFSHPKSEDFIFELLYLPQLENKRVLDLYAGSGTSAIASANIENLQLVMIQLNEPIKTKIVNKNIKFVSDITCKRMESRGIKYDKK